MLTPYFICYECGYIFEAGNGGASAEDPQECPACKGIKITTYSVRLNGDDSDSDDGCGAPAGFT